MGWDWDVWPCSPVFGDFQMLFNLKALNFFISPSTTSLWEKQETPFSPHNRANKSFLACCCFDNHHPVKGSLLCTALQCLYMQLCLHCPSLHCATVQRQLQCYSVTVHQQLQCFSATAVQQCHHRPVQRSAVCFHSAVLFWPTTTVQQCRLLITSSTVRWCCSASV